MWEICSIHRGKGGLGRVAEVGEREWDPHARALLSAMHSVRVVVLRTARSCASNSSNGSERRRGRGDMS
eukprot:37273-Rhodomonas_salina.1